MDKTRIAPSPTGIAHIGTAWMAMFNLALARKLGGKFVIRIEDTDRARFVPQAEAKIYEGLKWLGIDYDEGGVKGGAAGPYHQSERLEIYQKHAAKLLKNGWAYYCFATKEELEQMRREQIKRGELPKYDGRWREANAAEVKKRLAAGEAHVIRLKVPSEREIAWEDEIRGRVAFKSQVVDDQVLIKSDGFPTYHLANVVDDHLMGITYVLRGEEWISSTPKHLLLYEAFGWQAPKFAHMPLLRNKDKSKVSKRKNDVSILSYRDQGYLPEALLNFMALLGWSHPEGKEVFTLAEFIEVMSLTRVQKTAPVFDTERLAWYGGYYIRQLVAQQGINELAKRLLAGGFVDQDFPTAKMGQILPLVFERMVTLGDFRELTNFFWQPIEVPGDKLIKKSTSKEVLKQLIVTKTTLEKCAWTKESLEDLIRSLVGGQGYKKSQYFMMLRVAVTGKTATPPLFETMAVLGKTLVLKRLDQAMLLVKGKNAG